MSILKMQEYEVFSIKKNEASLNFRYKRKFDILESISSLNVEF